MQLKITIDYVINADTESLLDVSKAYKDAHDLEQAAAKSEHFVGAKTIDSTKAPINFNGDHKLNPREVQVLANMAQGKCNKLIARSLDITEATVKVHAKSIFQKINVPNRTAAAIWAIHNSVNGF